MNLLFQRTWVWFPGPVSSDQGIRHPFLNSIDTALIGPQKPHTDTHAHVIVNTYTWLKINKSSKSKSFYINNKWELVLAMSLLITLSV